MDSFTASIGSLPNSAVMNYIASQAQDFRQHVGEDTWSKFERQREVVEFAAPALTRDQIKRLELQRSQVLNTTAVEKLDNPFRFKTTTTFNQDLVLSNPFISNMHELRQIEAYGQKHNATRNTVVWNRINSGMVRPNIDGVLTHTEYADDGDSFKSYNNLTALDRRVALGNSQRAVALAMEGIDFSSIFSGGL
jgi:hypothetical protein